MKVFAFTFAVLIALAYAEEAISSADDLELENNIDRTHVELSKEGRITNGYSAASGQFPYQVGLSLSLGFFQSSWCGGSLIAENWVLTAAHCVEGVRSATVYLGATARNSPAQTIKVSKSDLIAHEKYNSQLIQNDIALIRLPSKAKLSRKIQTIDLPSRSKSFVGERAVVSGWGLEYDDGNVADSLNYAYLTISNLSKCRAVFGSRSCTSKNVCAATPNYTSTCQGDSGGPLVATSEDVQIGIVSYGHVNGCAKGYPVVFTDVSSFLPWIEQKTGLKF